MKKIKGILLATKSEDSFEGGFVVKITSKHELRGYNIPVYSVQEQQELVVNECVSLTLRMVNIEGEDRICAVHVKSAELSLEDIESFKDGSTEKSKTLLYKAVEETNQKISDDFKIDKLSGSGGVRHKYLQNFIAEIGNKNGFRSEIESLIPGTKRSVDVVLHQKKNVIAFEVVVSNVRNAADQLMDCLHSGVYSHIICVSDDTQKINKIQASIGIQYKRRIHFFLPEEIENFIFSLCRSVEIVKTDVFEDLVVDSLKPDFDERVKRMTAEYTEKSDLKIHDKITYFCDVKLDKFGFNRTEQYRYTLKELSFLCIPVLKFQEDIVEEVRSLLEKKQTVPCFFVSSKIDTLNKYRNFFAQENVKYLFPEDLLKNIKSLFLSKMDNLITHKSVIKGYNVTLNASGYSRLKISQMFREYSGQPSLSEEDELRLILNSIAA